MKFMKCRIFYGDVNVLVNYWGRYRTRTYSCAIQWPRLTSNVAAGGTSSWSPTTTRSWSSLTIGWNRWLRIFIPTRSLTMVGLQVGGTLIIKEAMVEDSGKYLCMVNNSVGGESVETVLTVTGLNGLGRHVIFKNPAWCRWMDFYGKCMLNSLNA